MLTLITMLFGLLEMGTPVDLSLRVLRNKLRAHDASGQIVLVGIDDKALLREGPWPWKRARLAELTDDLFAAGAKRVFFNLPLQAGDAKDDGQFVRAVSRYPGRIFVGINVEPQNLGANRPVAPMAALDGKVTQVSAVRWIRGYWNGVEDVPYRRRLGGRELAAIDSALANVYGGTNEKFPIDYAIRSASVPYVSASDISAAPGQSRTLSGKDVLVGFNTQALAAPVMILGQQRSSLNAAIVLGAETLKAGRPIMAGWLPPFLLALIAASATLYGKRRLSRLGGVVALVALLILPVFLETLHVFVDISPALILLLAAMIRAAWQRFGAEQRDAGTINPVSGLFTTNAIRHDDGLDRRLLIAARIRRFAEVVSTLPPHAEQAWTKQIVTRLEFGAGGAQLLHGDDGNFFWLADAADFDLMVEQFEALHVLFRNPIRVEDKSFDVDISFGLDREFGMPLSHRLISALAAAHAASTDGICWKLHDPAAAGAKEWSLSLLGELDQAILAQRVWVAYQPKYDLTTRRIIGAEALVRWTHETRGPISPQEFVEMAERHGRIGKLTAFVLDEALSLVSRILLLDPGFKIAVNISPSLLSDERIFEMVMQAIERHGVPSHCLILEVTETAAIAEAEMAQTLLRQFKAHGVGLSIDDYGTGLSTLEYLRKIPASELKIDRRFTAELCSSPADQVVMKSTIQLAHALGMTAVAEGIETAEALYLLASMGCDIGQGFHLARPMGAADIMGMLTPAARGDEKVAYG
ncbi:EAL domain-containing protein [Sphingobium aquiterrae]|uniref:EAL domain-containing protein n=1 Tax=Sphingobium aquiterrae TaxID=2038656 RepID=UPI00301AC71B